MHTSELDHNVHMEGLSSPRTEEILKEDDQLFKRLIDAIDDDTLLVVTSDHGLIESGHGGISPEERASFLFAYRKKGLMRSHPFMEKYFPYELTSSDIDNFDLTPTISLLINNAPPFNAIGDLLTEILPLKEDASHLEIAKYFLKLRKEILDQKIKLAQELREINKEHHELLENMLPLVNKTERLLAKEVHESEEEEYIEDCVQVIKQIKRQISLFKEYTSSRATVYDVGNAKVIMISAIIGMAGMILNAVLLFHRAKDSLKINFGFRGVGIVVLLGLALAHTAGLKVTTAIFAVYSVAILVVNLFEHAPSINPIPFFYFFFEHAHHALGYNRTGVILLSALVAFRIIENNNCTMTEHPLHSLFLLKVVIDFFICSLSAFLAGSSLRHGLSRPQWLFKRIAFLSAEIFLVFMLSLGDLTLLTTFKTSLNWVHHVIIKGEYMIGTLVPGAVLFFMILYYITKVSHLKPLSIAMFGSQYFLSLACIHYAEVDLFWGRQVVPLLILALTIYGLWFNFKVNRHLLLTKYHQLVLIFVSILPITLLIGGSFSAYNTLTQALLIMLFFAYEQQPSMYFTMNATITMRLCFYAAGQRITLNGICLNCGTLFYNDYHIMSWLVVFIKTIYPYILGSLFYLILILRHLEQEKSKAIHLDATSPVMVSARSTSAKTPPRKMIPNQHLKEVKEAGASWVFVFFMVQNVMGMGDALGSSILFTVDSTNVMIYQASSSYLYQFQIFAWFVCLKFLFFLLN